MLQVEQIERQEHTDRQALAALRAGGAEIEIPEAGSYRREFDGLLVADKPPETSREALLRRLRG